ncbi:MAG: hypothetical protein AB1593_08070 [Pseudomonadota bacterium]
MITRLVLVLPFVLLTACGAGAPAPASKPLPEAPPPPALQEEDRLVCPADVKECPDGSFVSRIGTRCEFAACPAEKK